MDGDRSFRLEPDQWTALFDALSRSHRGWLATLRIMEPGEAPRVEARQVPFEGITHDSGTRCVSLQLSSLGHVIARPVHVWVVSRDGAEKAVEIESADGTRAILEFRSALPADMIDGIAADRRPRQERS
jgi:hypothetical protein